MRLRTDEPVKRALEGLFLVFAATVFVIFYSHNASGLTFFFDEWTFLTGRRLTTAGLLEPHNGHLSIIPVAVYLVLRRLFGLSSYVPFQVAGAVVHMSVAGVCYWIVRRKSLPFAMALCAPVLLLGSGWQNIMWPFQIGMMGSLLFGILAIDEASKSEPRTQAVVFVGLSLMCAGGGVAATAVVGLLLLAGRHWRRAAELSVVVLLYGAWFLTYGNSQSQPGNLALTPRYVLDSAAGAGAGTAARSAQFGWAVCVAVLLVAVWRVVKYRSEDSTRMTLGLLVFLLATWTLTGISRAHLHEPAASRYVYVGSIVLLLILSVRSTPFSNPLLYGLPIVTWFVFVGPNISVLSAGAGGLRDTSQHVKASLTALDIARQRPSSDSAVDDTRAPQLSIFSYDRISASYGKVGYRRSEIPHLEDVYRADVDSMLNRIGLSPVRTLDDVPCGLGEHFLSGSMVIHSRMRLVVQSDLAAEVPLRRYSSDAELSDRATFTAGLVTEISNLAPSSVRPLTINLPAGNIRGCVLPVED